MSDPEDEQDIWKIYARHVQPVSRSVKAKVERIPLKPMRQDSVQNRQSAVRKPLPGALTDEVLSLVPAFDRRTEKKLRDGSVHIEARIDLHGMTQNEAYKALDRFMTDQVASRHRVVLIITGKGRGGDGVLRSHLQGWISSLPSASSVMAIRPAALRHGGCGACYVMLRKKKAPSA